MEKMIWKYLDELYPNCYRKRTKFGLCATDEMGKPFHLLGVSKNVSLVFSCPREYTIAVVADWCSSLPAYTNIPNSTNHDVLISEFN
jgi:hypothetical protein